MENSDFANRRNKGKTRFMSNFLLAFTKESERLSDSAGSHFVQNRIQFFDQERLRPSKHADKSRTFLTFRLGIPE